VTWVAVPKLPRGTWVFATLGCTHIRVLRYGEEIPEGWELIFCMICANYEEIRHAGVIRV
jgi:hypothetical protein